MNRTVRTLAATATGALALGVGLGLAGLASADPTTSPSPSPSASASASPSTPSGGTGDHRGGRGGGVREDGLASQLADKLGVDQAKVETALQDYREANRPATRQARDTADKTEDDAALAKALAKALDVDQAKVTAALAEIRTARQAERDQAVEDRLATAVTDGTLTQAEADAVKKAADAGIVRVGRR